MTELIYRYRLLMVIVVLLLTALVIWAVFFKNDLSGLPSNGVFV